MKSYRALEQRFRRIAAVNGALAVLGWDQSTMMPEGGAKVRAEQMAVLSVVRHEWITDPAIGGLLGEAEARKDRLNEWQRANLREMQRQWRHATALTPRLVEARSKATLACEMVWRKARANNHFKSFATAFAPVLELTREVAAAKAAAFGLSPYDALLDEYEPEGRAAQIDALFADLGRFLPGFIDRAMARQAKRPAATEIPGPFPADTQRQVGLRFMKALGFDFRHGRLDVSLHPFTGGVPTDVRITTRYRSTEFLSSLMGILHETGHALYEQNLPSEWSHWPLGKARGMAVHESQSLFVEKQIGRNPAFWRWALPVVEKHLGEHWTLADILAHVHRVERGLIRVDADEVTYPLHVILRYELEQELVAGRMEVAAIPEAWDARMREYLDLSTIDNPADGPMQDVHWPSGAFGYFPSYTLGAMMAAQQWAALVKDHPTADDDLAVGDLSAINAWRRDRIWSQGSRWSTPELIQRATGEKLDAGHFIRHLRQRYGKS